MILLAALELEEQGQSPFTAEVLIVAAWRKFPRVFGLKGYHEQYPDSNKVLASIMGRKGLAKRAWLAKMGQKLYAVTREGRHAVRDMLEGGRREKAAEPVKLPRDQEKFLQGLLASTALMKFQQGRKFELTFADACRFWGITENLHGPALDTRLERLRDNLADLKRMLGRSSGVLSNGRSVEPEDIVQMGQVHGYLEDRFARHLTLLRSRTGRN
jgi:hypothetical protein